MLSFEFEHRGERRRLAVYRDAYAAGGNLALVMLDATDPREDGYLEEFGVLTVNLPGDHAAARWCARPGHVVLDTNDNPACLVGALEEQGVLRVAPASVRSGFCRYPLACHSRPRRWTRSRTRRAPRARCSPRRGSCPRADAAAPAGSRPGRGTLWAWGRGRPAPPRGRRPV